MSAWEIIALIAAGLICAALIIAALRALLLKKEQPPALPPRDGSRDNAAAAHLAELIKIETVSAGSGGDEGQFTRFRETLTRLYPLCFAAMETSVRPDGAWLMRLRGRGEGGAAVFMSHTDVVPAGGGWTHEPFGGEISGGRIWGRGTLDTKGSLCAIFEALEGLLADGYSPSRDICIASSCDEETSGGGAAATAAQLASLGKIDLVIDEGGYVTGSPFGARGKFANIGIMEKGYADMKVTASGKGGHASNPPKNTPAARLARFICRVERRSPFRRRINAPVRLMLRTQAPYMGFFRRLVFLNMWLFAPIAPAMLAGCGAQASALTRTTVCFTMLRGSDAPNVIPSEASAVANLRFAPHEGRDESLAVFEKLAAKYGLSVAPCGDMRDFTAPADTDGEMYALVERVSREIFSDAVTTPFVLTGGTDCRAYAPYCKTVLRCSALDVTREQLGRMHAADENIDVTALARAADFYRGIMEGVG